MKFLHIFLHFKHLQECSRFSHHKDKQAKNQNDSSSLCSCLATCSLPPFFQGMLPESLFYMLFSTWASLPYNCWKCGFCLRWICSFYDYGVFLTGKSVGLYCLKFLWCYSIILCETELSRCYYDFCFSLGLLFMDLFECSSLWYWSSQGLSLIHCPMFVDAFYTITFV